MKIKHEMLLWEKKNHFRQSMIKLVKLNRMKTFVTTKKNSCVLPIKEQPIDFKQASWQTQQDLSV